jgi:phospholipid/cholesterol/gamma-HCH transport system substrate-binding protein
MQDKKEYLREEIKAGAVILASFVILGAFIIMIGGSRFFEKSDTYYIKVMNAAGLAKGAVVSLGGVGVGRVWDIRQPEGPGKPLTIGISVKKGTILYKGTKALITQTGFVGDTYLLLSVDHTTAGRIGVGEEIQSEEKTDFSMIMTRVYKLSESVGLLTQNADRFFNEKNAREVDKLLSNASEAVVSISSNVDQVASSLRATIGQLDNVLSNLEEIVRANKGEVSKLIRDARLDINKAGDMIERMQAAASKVDSVSNSTGRAIEEVSLNLDNLLFELTKATEDLRDAIQEIRRKPWSVLYKERDGK